MYVAMQDVLQMYCNGKDTQQNINHSINGGMSFASIYSEDLISVN